MFSLFEPCLGGQGVRAGEGAGVVVAQTSAIITIVDTICPMGMELCTPKGGANALHVGLTSPALVLCASLLPTTVTMPIVGLEGGEAMVGEEEVATTGAPRRPTTCLAWCTHRTN